MTEADPVVLDDRASLSPTVSELAPPHARGRVLYCRKCEGHGKQIILKGHAPVCPYILCQCPSCEKLMNKRLKSFNKRNKEKIELATQLAAKRRIGGSDCDSIRGSTSTPSSGTSSPDTIMSHCSANQPGSSKTGLESRSMSMGAMTVMSYDIWKAQCAAEKKAREEREKERKASLPDRGSSPVELPPRKRAHTFVTVGDNQLPRINFGTNEKKKGRYITLPTIPPMSVLISEEDEKELTPAEVPPKEPVKPVEPKETKEAPLPAPVPLSKAPVLPSVLYSHQPARPSPLAAAPAPVLPQMFPLPSSMSTPLSTSLSTSMPTSLATTMPSSLPTEQILATMLPAATFPTSVLLQNSVLLQQQQQQQNLLSQLLAGQDLSALLSAYAAPQPAQPSMLELLQCTQQLQQVTQALSGASIEAPSCAPNLSNALFSQFIARQPLFTSTI